MRCSSSKKCKMLTYNNQLKQLALPEYGRNIQNMVDYCLTIEDRDERTACASEIVETMVTLFPPQGGDLDAYRQKLWDHVVIMSNFQLDVDFPYERTDPTIYAEKPEPVPPSRPGAKPFRHYGSLIPRLIETASQMEEGDERDALVNLIANQMKKTLMEAKLESASDHRILSDLRQMSHGALGEDPEKIRILDFKQAPTPSGRKKRKK